MNKDKAVEATIDTKAVEQVNPEKVVEPEKTAIIPLIKEDMRFRHGLENYIFKKGQRNVEVPMSVLQSIVNAGKF